MNCRHEFPPFKILAVERLARKPLPSALGLLRNRGSNRRGWRARIGVRWNAVLEVFLLRYVNILHDLRIHNIWHLLNTLMVGGGSTVGMQGCDVILLAWGKDEDAHFFLRGSPPALPSLPCPVQLEHTGSAAG